MTPDTPYGDIDLTSYLQTEGRRRAAELALQQGKTTDAPRASQPAPSIQQDAAHKAPPPQEQSSRMPRQAGSLTEVLQQMGVRSAIRRPAR